VDQDRLALMVQAYWPVVLGVLWLLWHLSKLQHRLVQAEVKIGKLEQKQDDMASDTIKQLSTIRESLARIEGRLDIQKKNDV
jgi:hypothetical protein